MLGGGGGGTPGHTPFVQLKPRWLLVTVSARSLKGRGVRTDYNDSRVKNKSYDL